MPTWLKPDMACKQTFGAFLTHLLINEGQYEDCVSILNFVTTTSVQTNLFHVFEEKLVDIHCYKDLLLQDHESLQFRGNPTQSGG